MARSGGICANGHGFYRGKGCPLCRAGKAVSPVLKFNHSGDPQYMSPETVAFHREHVREVEKGLAFGSVKEYRPGSNKSFRAELPKRVF